MEVQIRVEIQDIEGKNKSRAALGVPEDITSDELLAALIERYPDLVTERHQAFVQWTPKKAGTSNLVSEGCLVIIKPRSSGVRFIEDN